MSFSRIAFVVLVALFVGCTKGARESTPQNTLADYVQRTFSVKTIEDLDGLRVLTAGKVKAELESMSDEQFASAFLEKERKFESLKIRDERKVGDDKFSITYELTYLNNGAIKDRVTNKKHAIFVKDEGRWLISDVQNIKTFVDHQTEEKIERMSDAASEAESKTEDL